MDRIILQRQGVSNNFHATHHNFYFEVFHHIGWNLLCLSMQTWKGINGWKAVPVADYSVHHSKDRYTLGFHNQYKKPDRLQLIEFVKKSFGFELVFPVDNHE